MLKKGKQLLKLMKRKVLISVVTAVISLTVFMGNAYTQNRNTAAGSSTVLVGQVIDKSTGENITGAEVKIGGETRAVTNSGGEFIVDAIDPGTYKVTVEAEDYKSWTKRVSVSEQGKKIMVKLEGTGRGPVQ